MSGQQWWCDACATTHPVGGGWYAVWRTTSGGCTVQPNVALGDVSLPWREEVYACGQLTALILVERFLHTGTFTALPALPAIAPVHPGNTLGNVAAENF